MAIPIAEEVRAHVNGSSPLAGRNPFSDDPFTDEELSSLWYHLNNMWEDTQLVTSPNLMRVLTVGHVKALVRELQRAKLNDA